jgi:hypothetical protein
MISTSTYPRTKADLIRALQRMQIDRLAIVEPYADDRKGDLDAALRDLSRGTGNVTIIVVRSR